MDTTARTLGPPDVDLTTCDREPIHQPGAIQAHGVLFAASRGDLRITAVSANAEAYCGVAAANLLDTPLSRVLAADAHQAVAQFDLSAAGEPVRLPRLRLLGGPAQAWCGTLHAAPDGIVLEAELLGPQAAASALDHFERFQTASQRLMTARDGATVQQRLVDETRRLTGYGRVMLYRFAPDWNGEVIAEAADSRMASYLGLHFPASDIPVQARALYARHPERQIPDVGYRPVALLQTEAAPLELGHVGLRSVSPAHLAYLRNMGVVAAMSVSLLQNGRLWGLVACHHLSALAVAPEVRQSCVLLAQIAIARLSLIEEVEAARRRRAVRAVEAKLLREAAEGDETADTLLHVDLLKRNSGALLDLLGATGLAIRSEGATTLFGDTPTGAALTRIFDWLGERAADTPLPEPLLCDHLAEQIDEVGSLEAAGLLAVPLGRAADNFAVWFRPELARSVTWAGDPVKPMEVVAGLAQLTPRRSFAAWTVEVRGRSLPWSNNDAAAAASLRDTLAVIVIRRAGRIHERLNAQLRRSNEELESFAYIASHDLKEPLRQIEVFGSLLQRAFGRTGDPPEKIQSWFSGITTSSRRLRALIDHLATFARLGNEGCALAPLDLDAELAAVLRDRDPQLTEAGATVTRSTLPMVTGDATQLRQVMENLIGNAIKYRSPQRPLALAIAVELASKPGDPLVRISFSDNGIGFQERFCERIFKPFERLHSAETYEGSGLGLAICRKVLEHHGGGIAASSQPGVGSVFTITLPRHSPPHTIIAQNEDVAA